MQSNGNGEISKPSKMMRCSPRRSFEIRFITLSHLNWNWINQMLNGPDVFHTTKCPPIKYLKKKKKKKKQNPAGRLIRERDRQWRD